MAGNGILGSAVNTGKYRCEDIYYVEEGIDLPPLLLLHGWGGDSNSLKVISSRISGYRKTLRIALPGFGASPEPTEPWGTWDYVETINRWISDRFPNQPVDIAAHSFGGRIAIGLASHHPETVNRLILIGSAGLRPKRSFAVRLKRFYSKQLRSIGRIIKGKFGERIEIVRQQLGSDDWRNASPLMRGTLSRVLDEDLSSELKTITKPTLLIWGSKDTATPVWMGRAMELLIPGAELKIIEDTGHYCFLDRPGETTSAIWKFLELPEAW